jgi:hypothetical protein
MNHVQDFQALQGRGQPKSCRLDAQDSGALKRSHGGVCAIGCDFACERRVQLALLERLGAVKQLPQYKTLRLYIQVRIIRTHSEAFAVSLCRVGPASNPR